MPTAFDEMDAALSAAIGEVFGEVAVITPRLKAQYVDGVADPARPAQQVRGIYSSGPSIERIGDGRGNASAGYDRAMQTSSFWLDAIEAAKFVDGLRPGDRVTFPARPALRMRISACQASDMGDLEILLVSEDAV
jgi:hypothetical protein